MKNQFRPLTTSEIFFGVNTTPEMKLTAFTPPQMTSGNSAHLLANNAALVNHGTSTPQPQVDLFDYLSKYKWQILSIGVITIAGFLVYNFYSNKAEDEL